MSGISYIISAKIDTILVRELTKNIGYFEIVWYNSAHIICNAYYEWIDILYQRS